MANEVLSTGLQSELLVYSPHGIDIKIDAYVVIIDNQYPPQSFETKQTREEKKIP